MYATRSIQKHIKKLYVPLSEFLISCASESSGIVLLTLVSFSFMTEVQCCSKVLPYNTLFRNPSFQTQLYRHNFYTELNLYEFLFDFPDFFSPNRQLSGMYKLQFD